MASFERLFGMPFYVVLPLYILTLHFYLGLYSFIYIHFSVCLCFTCTLYCVIKANRPIVD